MSSLEGGFEEGLKLWMRFTQIVKKPEDRRVLTVTELMSESAGESRRVDEMAVEHMPVTARLNGRMRVEVAGRFRRSSGGHDGEKRLHNAFAQASVFPG